jgi:hypothetical protein
MMRVMLQAAARMWTAKIQYMRRKRAARKREAYAVQERRWNLGWEARNSLVTVEVTPTADGTRVHVSIEFTRETLRYGWQVMSDSERELHGVRFQDPGEQAWYAPGSDTVYWAPALGYATLIRPVYEFW